MEKNFAKSCAVCFKYFESNWSHAKICSKECRRKYGKAYAKIYDEKTYLKLRFDLFKRDDFKCQYCGRTAQDKVILEIEHIKPISKGGKTTAKNLITSCSECNLGKGDKLLQIRQEEKFQQLAGEHNEYNQRFETKWKEQMENIQRNRSKLADCTYVGEGNFSTEQDTSTST